MARPVAFAAPADIALDPDPIRADWVIEGSPKARSKYLAGSADGAASVMAWSCTAGRFQCCYKVDEVLHIISARSLSPTNKARSAGSAQATWLSSPRAPAACGTFRTR
jgi:uncharacterized cupin superfamily protein